MSVKSAPYYWLECDHEGCGNKSIDAGDFTAWSDENDAFEEAYGSDWATMNGKDYCDGHASEHEGEHLESENEGQA